MAQPKKDFTRGCKFVFMYIHIRIANETARGGFLILHSYFLIRIRKSPL